MKNLTLAICLLGITPAFALGQSMQGSWQLTYFDAVSMADREMTAILSEDYFMFGSYHTDGRFISAGGGFYEQKGDNVMMTFDFYTDDPSIVRQPLNFNFDLNDDELTLSGNVKGNQFTQKWKKIDAESTPLDGDWRFAARVDEDGNAGDRRTPGPRQTVKLLGGERFQWAAFNYETKEFMGTGGGTFEAKNGKYTENIEFFSRDDQRVGASLSFQFERKGDDWYHKGKSSKGDPLHEIWTVEE